MATRRERVILDLQDDFSAKMIKAASAAALLNRELDAMSGKSAKFDQSSQVFVRDVQKMGREAEGAGKAVDRMSGRIGLAVDALLTLGPAAIPIGALAVPAVMTLTSSLAALAVGAGATAIAFGGVGDALSAANKAHLEPTVENLAAAEELFSRLAPAVEEFSKQFNSMRGLGAEIRNAGAQALFPGLTEALESLESRGPEAIRLMIAFNEVVGDNAADAAASLASDKWNDFFALMEREGPATLDKTADAIGNLAHGVSELLEAFAPMTADGMDWIGEQAEDFNRWATGLKRTEGFKDFSDYIRDTGPQVAETLGAMSRALLDILEAAAPLGGPALQAIEAMSEAISSIANSGFATEILAVVGAMRALNRLAPATAGSMALLGGGAAAGAGGRGGNRGRGGRGGRGGVGAGAAFAALIGADLLAAEAGWEEASAKQIAKGKEFADKWGASVGEQANKAFFEVLGEGLGDVSNVFGMFPDPEGASQALLSAPLEKQIALRKQLREEYGVGFAALEREGFLIEGTTEKLKRQRESVDVLANDLERLGLKKAAPKVDLDDGVAKQKQREADDWILGWGKKNAKATIDADGKPAKTMLEIVGDMLKQTDDTTAVPKIDIDDGNSRGIMADVRAELARLDGMTATTFVRTVRTGDASPGFGPQDASGAAAGTTVPDAPGAYRDQFLYALAQREEVVSNRRGQADRFRPVLKAINADMPRSTIKGMLADGGTAGKEREEDRRAKAKERKEREESLRLRKLDNQRMKDLLKSDLRNDQEQARLELEDARRRLKSAKEAGRPRAEIRQARLDVKTERIDVQDMRSERRQERLEAAAQKQIDAAEIALKAAEDQVGAAEEHLRAAEDQMAAAEQTLEATQQLRDSLDETVSNQFSGSLTGGGLSGLMATLAQDTNAGTAMTDALAGLTAAGLDTTGPAAGLFEELASSNDLTTVNELLAAGPAAIEAAEQAFAAREAANAARGDMVADAFYGEVIAQQTAAVDIANQQVAIAEAAKANAEAHAIRLEAQVASLEAATREQGQQFAAALNGVASSVSQLKSKGWANVANWK